MADLDDRLNQLISDQESMNKVLAMAKAILAQRDSASPEPAKPEPTVPPSPTAAPDLTALLSSVLESSSPGTSDPSTDTRSEQGTTMSQDIPAIAAMLPQLLQALSGDGNLIKSERVNLINAMRPYLKEGRLQSIDRALKMANVTKAATSAMHLLGR